ncbi:MAG: sulfatase [bacterium]
MSRGLAPLLAAVTLAVGSYGRAEAASAGPAAVAPPVVIVVFDALRADHLGLYGYRARPTSPTFDRLAGESIVLDDARAAAPYTLASVATLLTGRPPDEHTLTTFERALPRDVPTLPHALASSGYRSLVASRSGILHGFALEDSFELELVDPQLTEDPRAFRSRWKEGIGTLAAGPQPWFAYLHFFPPHAPYRPPKAFTVPFVLPNVEGVSGSIAFLRALDSGATKLGAAALDALVARYDANIRYADHELADLLDHLGKLGVLERAWLVVTSDHGEAFGEHGRFEHNSTVYEEMVKVPLLVRPPGGAQRATRIGEPVGLVDLAPTVLAWAGQPVPAEMAGRPLPLAPGARYAARPRPITLRSASPPVRFGITDGDWKYVRPLDDSAASSIASEELYDLAADPRERTNLAGTRGDVLARFRESAAQELARQRAHAAAPRTLEAMPSETGDALRALGYVQ